jgi:hypothetical protein
MQDIELIISHSFVWLHCTLIAWNVDASVLAWWNAEAAWTRAIHDCKDLAWELTWESFMQQKQVPVRLPGNGV